MNRRKVLSGMGMTVAATAFGHAFAAKNEFGNWPSVAKTSARATVGGSR